jgi:hypothetical protein
MAIRIPILTSFDPKGLRQANASFAKLQGSVGSLGRNFAVAGAAIAAAGAVIAKNVQSLARIERINAQTAQTITSMGNASNISAKEVESLAGSLEALTATEAETIQEGANLLLTFRNITNQVGAGNDIFNQTTAIMVDMGRALNEGASASAIRLGKALNDPIRGITALRKVGVGFSKDQEAQIKAMQESGDLMGAQKVILAELQAQFGGSGAAYAKTFSGQLELMGHELGTIGEEATMSVMPALQGMVGQLRELIPVIGPQLKAAIESVDFVALGQSVVGFTTFLVQNAEAIAKTIAAIFIISTAYKTMAVAAGIAKVATDLYKWSVAQATAGVTLKTIAVNALSSALKLLPFVAVVAGLVSITTELVKAANNFTTFRGEIDRGATSMSQFDKDLAAVSATFLSFDIKGNPFLQLLQDAITLALQLTGALDRIPKEITTKINISAGYDSAEARRMGEQAFGRGGLDMSLGKFTPTPTPTPTGGAGGAAAQALSPLQQLTSEATRNIRADKQALKLEGAGLSKEVAAWVTSVDKPVVAAREALQRIDKRGATAVARLTRDYNNSNAGRAAASAAAAAADQARIAADQARVAAEEAAQRAEAERIAERERVFKSFADSVKNTFAGIKNSIMGAFDLTQLGGSTNSITRNMDKLLTRLRSFATNVKSLATMGLNPALLQQIISAGPMAGARLAEGLVMGGAGGLSAINAGYAEFGALSGQIAQTGTESLFGTGQQQTVYNINVDGGVGSGATIGKAIVDAIKAYERTSGAVWQGA